MEGLESPRKLEDSAHPSPSLTSPIRLWQAFVQNNSLLHHGNVVFNQTPTTPHDVGKKTKDKKSPTSRWNPCSIGVRFVKQKSPRRLSKSRREYGVQGEPLLRFLGGVLCRIAKNAHYDKQRIYFASVATKRFSPTSWESCDKTKRQPKKSQKNLATLCNLWYNNTDKENSLKSAEQCSAGGII